MGDIDGGRVYQDCDGDWYAVYSSQMYGSFGSPEKASEFLEMVKMYHIKMDSYIEYLNDRILEDQGD